MDSYLWAPISSDCNGCACAGVLPGVNCTHKWKWECVYPVGMALSSLVLENRRIWPIAFGWKKQPPIKLKFLFILKKNFSWELKYPSNPWACPCNPCRGVSRVFGWIPRAAEDKNHVMETAYQTLGRSSFVPGRSWVFPHCPLSLESLFGASIANLPQTQGTAKLLAAKLCWDFGCSSLTPLLVGDAMTPAGIHPGTLPRRLRRNSWDAFPSDHNIFHMLPLWRRRELGTSSYLWKIHHSQLGGQPGLYQCVPGLSSWKEFTAQGTVVVQRRDKPSPAVLTSHSCYQRIRGLWSPFTAAHQGLLSIPLPVESITGCFPSKAPGCRFFSSHPLESTSTKSRWAGRLHPSEGADRAGFVPSLHTPSQGIPQPNLSCCTLGPFSAGEFSGVSSCCRSLGGFFVCPKNSTRLEPKCLLGLGLLWDLTRARSILYPKSTFCSW